MFNSTANLKNELKQRIFFFAILKNILHGNSLKFDFITSFYIRISNQTHTHTYIYVIHHLSFKTLRPPFILSLKKEPEKIDYYYDCAPKSTPAEMNEKCNRATRYNG